MRNRPRKGLTPLSEPEAGPLARAPCGVGGLLSGSDVSVAWRKAVPLPIGRSDGVLSVVRHTREDSLDRTGYITNLVVRTSGDPLNATALRRAIHEVDPTQAVSGIGTIEQDVAKVLARPRLQAALVTCFAVIAVALAVIGVYGLIADVVALRTHEIGIRLALGATREKVFFELFGQGAQLVFAGLIVGVAGAVALRKIASTFVFGVTTGDPLTYLFAALTFSAVALAAVILPAAAAVARNTTTSRADSSKP
jgi:ABC-type lipoprotein release transport system permease subunit